MSDHCIIATAATETKGYFDALQSQVHAAGIDFIYQQLKTFTWAGLVDWELALAKSFPDALIAFCDAWDMLFLGTRREFEDVVGAQPLLLHAEKACWPDSSKASLYPPADSPWRFVNGTGPAGTGAAIADAIEYGMAHFPITGDGHDVYDTSKDNDQRFWTDIYLAGIGKLDTECRLSQSLVMAANGDFAVKDERLVNKITGSRPLFVHANGASAMLGWKPLMDILSIYRVKGIGW